MYITYSIPINCGSFSDVFSMLRILVHSVMIPQHWSSRPLNTEGETAMKGIKLSASVDSQRFQHPSMCLI